MKKLTEQTEQNLIIPWQKTENIPGRERNVKKESDQSVGIFLAENLRRIEVEVIKCTRSSSSF